MCHTATVQKDFRQYVLQQSIFYTLIRQACSLITLILDSELRNECAYSTMMYVFLLAVNTFLVEIMFRFPNEIFLVYLRGQY